MRSESDFLRWLADRLVEVYHESPNVDFVQKLRNVADSHDRMLSACNLIIRKVGGGENPTARSYQRMREAVKLAEEGQ